MTLLLPVANDTKLRAYCGPTAIASITGVPISKIRRKLHRLRGRYGSRRITGLGTTEILETMKRLGWRVVEEWRAPKRKNWVGWQSPYETMTLRRWCEDHAHREGPFIIVAGHHYLAVSSGMLCDTMSDGKPVPWAEHPNWLMKRVTRYWRFAGKTKVPADPKPRAPKPPVDHPRRRHAEAQAALARLQTRAKRIATAIKKRKRQVAYYERKFAA